MNTDVEIKLTALLLGELPADEAAALREAIARDAELAQLYKELERTIDLVRETAVTPADETGAQPVPLKLSPERRENLHAQFKTVRPKEFARPRRRVPVWLVPASVAAMLIVFIGLSISLTHLHRNVATLSGGGDESDLRASVIPRRPAPVDRPGVALAPRPEPQIPSIPAGDTSVDHLYLRTQGALPSDSIAPKGYQYGDIAGVGPRSVVPEPPPPPSPVAWTTRTPIVLPQGGKADGGIDRQKTITVDSLTLGAAPGSGEMERGRIGGNMVVQAGNSEWIGGRQGFEAVPPTSRFAPSFDSVVTPLARTASGSFVLTAVVTNSQTFSLADTTAGVADGMSREGVSLGLRPPEGKLKDRFADVAESTPSGQGDLIYGWQAGRALTQDEAKQVRRFGDSSAVSRGGRPQDKEQDLSDAATSSPRIVLNGITGGLRPKAPEGSTGSSGVHSVSAVGYVNQPLNDATLDTLTKNADASALPGRDRPVAQPSAKPSQDLRVERMAQAREAEVQAERLLGAAKAEQLDAALPKTAAPIPVPSPEFLTRENAFSTFSMNVSDVSFKLAAASLEKGVLPDPASIRSEEFINAFDYRDPEPAAGSPIAFAWERAGAPFTHNRDLLRFSIKTAAQGRQAGRPLNLVLLLDNSGSMERADRVRIIRESLRVLAAQLQPQDMLSVVVFSRTARLWVDGVAGSQAGTVADGLSQLTPEGGTNLEEAMRLAYETASRHYLAAGINRVVLLTDGAANLGDVDPDSLKRKVESYRRQGIALDCFGIGWEGYNDDLLEVLSRHGDGRYGFINTPKEADTEFAARLAGALRVAAADVKVQVEFNPARVTAYRQVGYAKLQLTKEQFRDNRVDAAEIGAAESGNALYVIEVNAAGQGPLGTVRVRYKVPDTGDYREQEWTVPYTGGVASLEQGSAPMRLAGTTAAFAEWLATSPFAGEVTTDRLLGCLGNVPEVYGADARPKQLEWMIRQAQRLAGK
jgi:Mg-chelatase subunit ChlD